MPRVRKAVIPAAGWGTRFLPATKDVPKEMLPVVDKPAIHYVVEDAVAAGCDLIYIITGRGKEAIQRYFDRAPELENVLKKKGKTDLLNQISYISEMAEMRYITQKEQKGLGHAILCSKLDIENDNFHVLLGDDVFSNTISRQLALVHKKYPSPLFAVQEVSPEDISKFGAVDSEKFASPVLSGNSKTINLYRVKRLVEKPKPEEAPSYLATMGRYIFPPEIFDYIEKTKPGIGGEIQLTDAMNEMNKEIEFIACEYEGTRYDLGDKVGWLIANSELALERDDVGPGLYAYFKSPRFREKLRRYEERVKGRKVGDV